MKPIPRIKNYLADIPRQQFVAYSKLQIVNVVISCYEQVKEMVNRINEFINKVNAGEYSYILTNEDKQEIADMIKPSEIGPIDGNKMIITTYQKLKELRDNSQLIPGMQYRITDYDGKITETYDVTSARHQFDIIVIADDVNVLNENARAICHEGDDYFANQNLEKWELKYNIDNKDQFGIYGNNGGYEISFLIYNMLYVEGLLEENDNTYEGYPYKISILIQQEQIPIIIYLNNLSDNNDGLVVMEGILIGNIKDVLGNISNIQIGELQESGHGYITFMKDDKDNCACYDFKNIKFARYKIITYNNYTPYEPMYGKPIEGVNGDLNVIYDLENRIFMYTFNDHGEDGSLLNTCRYNHINGISFDNVFFSMNDSYHTDSDKIFMISYNTLNQCTSNTFGNYAQGNTLNIGCSTNIFGNHCNDNIFNGACYNNVFGYGCSNNKFGEWCSYNIFDGSSYNNVFGKNLYRNIFNYSCDNNIIKNNCSDNIFGSNCSNNTIGNGCTKNIFGDTKFNITMGNYYTNNIFGQSKDKLQERFSEIVFGNNCKNNHITCSKTISDFNYCNKVHINDGVSDKNIVIPTINNTSFIIIQDNNNTIINV